MADDALSGWTFKEVGPGGATATAAAPQDSVQADITKHDPQTYATLTSQAAVKNLQAMGLMPDIGTAKDIYTKALEESQNHWKQEAEAAHAKQLDIQARQAAVTQPTDASGKPIGPSLAQTEELQRSAAGLPAQQQMEAWKQGPGAYAKAASQPGGVSGGEVKGLSDDDTAKLDMFRNGYNAVKDLENSFQFMMSGGNRSTAPVLSASANPVAGTGGFWRSLGGKLGWFAEATSPAAKNFERQREISNIPISRAVMGETGATPTKERMMEIAQNLGLPNIVDDEETGNGQLYNFKRTIINNLQAMYNNRTAAGNVDTGPLAKALADFHADFDSPASQKWNPVATQPIIQIGQSAQGQATIRNLNARASIGTGANAAAGTAPPSTVAPNQTYVAPPSWGAPAPVTYPTISNDPGTPPAPAGIMALVNAPGQVLGALQAATPRPGGPLQDLTQPPSMASPNPQMWGR